MPLFHHKNYFSPSQMTRRDVHPLARLGAGRAGLIMRMVIE